jgi:6-phosphogluconolactonase/glucosamine-6-phosphate isomerase/deaminase
MVRVETQYMVVFVTEWVGISKEDAESNHDMTVEAILDNNNVERKETINVIVTETGGDDAEV